MDDRIAIRTMTRVDLDRAIDWAAAEGWNPGLDDAAPFRAADPDGFLMAFRDGAPVACISAVAYGARFGFLGFYICSAEQRGRGFGMAVWRVALDRLGDRVIGLDGVVAQQDNYRKSGFVLAHRNVRYGGTVAIDEPADPRIVPIDGTLRDAIVAYDQPFFPGPRRAFLEAWLTPARRRGLAYVEDGAVRGYGVVRACRNGHKIGPLFADDAADRRRAVPRACGRGGRRAGVSRSARVQPRIARALWPRARVRDRAHVSRPGARPAARASLRHHDVRARLIAGSSEYCGITID
jgi:hypothetical protein